MSRSSTDPSPARETVAAKAAAPIGEVLPRLVNGRYVLLRLLVRGGMGEVYLATTIGIEGAERPCVIKRIRADYRADPSFHARFLDEARVQSQLDDPGVARIMEASVDEHGDPYVAVEFVEGRSLADVRSRLSRLGKPMPWADAVAVTLEIASALAHVHERTGADGAPLGIVHRDLSPQNVMVGFAGDVKLIDFGTARGDNRRCHTVSGTVLAKPGYVAPEVARADAATPRADIYALGVMLWEMVVGRRFLEGDASAHVAAVTEGSLRPALLSGDPTLAAHGDGPVPAELDRIVQWMTEPLPSARCSRAREAAQALSSLIALAPRRPVEERGVRARVKAMLARLYPSEPAGSRVEFARLVARARRTLSAELSESPRGSAVKSAVKNERDASSTPSEPVTSVADALPGTRYRLIRRLGEGAMGVVYEAEHVDLGRRVAVKVLQPKHSSSPEFVARFRREARAIAGLAHPNLVHVYDFGQTTGAFAEPVVSEGEGKEEGRAGDVTPRLFFVMEKLEGETLEDYLDREKGVDWRDACELAIKTCRALEAAHAAGLVHRDLKPANLFLTYGGRRPSSLAEIGLKLLDFGVAKGMAGSPFGEASLNDVGPLADDPNLSHAGAIFGTPETMAPEQVSAGAVDARADLYALGCVLYQLVTGRAVFDAPSPILMMSCHLRQQPVPPREVAPTRGIPESIERVILRALQKEPSDRFADAGQMREALEEACYGAFFEDAQRKTTPGERATEPSEDIRASVDHAAMDVAIVDGAMDAIDVTDGADAREASTSQPHPSHPRTARERLAQMTEPRRRRSYGPLAFAAFAGLALLGAAGFLKRDAVKDTYAQVVERLDGPTMHVVVATAPARPNALAAKQARPSTPEAPASLAMASEGKANPIAPTGPSAKEPELAAVAPPHATSKAHPTTKPKGSSAVAKSSATAATKESAPKAVVVVTLPDAPSASAAESDAKLASGDVEGALEAARVARADGTTTSLRAWARSAFAAGHPSESHEACVAWLAKAGDVLEAELLDARALRAAGRSDDARDRLEDTIKVHPKSGEAKSLLMDLQTLHKTKKVGAVKKVKRRLAMK